jgi:hypothetical protein
LITCLIAFALVLFVQPHSSRSVSMRGGMTTWGRRNIIITTSSGAWSRAVSLDLWMVSFVRKSSGSFWSRLGCRRSVDLENDNDGDD